AAVGKVADPSAHAMLERHPPAGGTEVDALNPASDQHPIPDHKQTVRHGSQRCGTEGRQMSTSSGSGWLVRIASRRALHASIIAARDQGVHLPNVKVGFQR